METGVLTRDSVSHGTFKNTVVDKRHSKYRRSQERDDKRVVELDDSDALRLYRIKRIRRPPHFYVSKTHITLFMITTYHAIITPL